MASGLESLRAALADRYSVERELGAGGMATVYFARDLKHDREVAIKVLAPDLAAAMGPERFLSEISVTARLRHPNILPLFDSGEADGVLYYVMPFVAGGSLRARIDRDGRLPLDEALRISGEVAEALSHAHEQGIVHRDVKPENILFDSGHALVADFGISRALSAEDGERLTGTGLSLGTPTYMSPEQAAGERSVSRASDIYSLACMTYEMLAGKPPFTGTTTTAVIGQHLSATPPAIRAIRPEVPEALSRALTEALAKDPGDRPPSATDLAHRLLDATTARAIAAEARRRRLAAWGRAAVVAVVAVTAGSGGWWLTSREQGPRFHRLAVLPLADYSENAGEGYLVAGIHEGLINELARAGIPTIARQSTLQFAETDLSIRDIATLVSADAIVQGSVVPQGDSVVISASLVDARTEETVWSGSFAGALSNILGLFRDVTREIASQIRASLTPAQEARLAEAPSVDPELYLAYQRGVFHAQFFTPEDLATALTYFETALQIDSLYAPAYVGIARVWGFRSQAGQVPPRVSRPHIDSALARALSIDSTLDEAQMLLAGLTTWGDRNWSEGEARFRRAIEQAASPRVEAEARMFYGHLLTILGRWEEGDEQVTRGLSLDPLNPFIIGLYGAQRTMTRRYDEAIQVFEDLYASNRGASFGRGAMADAYLKAGRPGDAIEIRRQLLERSGFGGAAAALDEGYREGGARLAFRRAAEALASSQVHAPPTQVMIVLWAAAGEVDRALEWIEVAFDRGDQNLPYLGVQPILEPLHDDPRFLEVLDRLDLPLVTKSLSH